MACPTEIRIATVLTRDMKVHKNEDGSIEFSGLHGRILDIILKAMKVEFKLLIPEDGEWGRLLPNGSWTGMIGKIQKNEADIAFNSISVNEERMKVVDFSKPYSTDYMTFAITKSEAVTTAWAFIYAFDSFYSSVLLSILSVPSQIPTVINFKELSAAVVKGEYKCYSPKGSATLDAFFNSNKEYLEKLGHIILSNSWYSDNETLIENSQISRKSALISSREQLQMVAGPEDWKPNFLSEDNLIQQHCAVAIRKDYCRKEIINTLITRFNYAGLYSKILSDDHFLAWLAASDQRRIVIKEGKPLSLSILLGAFGLLLFGLGLSCIAFIGEVIYSYFQS
ncbi:Glutamate receptor ionotropic like protein [Argiope bruennichi]|uniref:Glutamate receptor ionotropic like protein n=1 Tax=Argiope bruennichi TaxID=94029 RepID=A0A8T0EGY4_ARGBR|nr:Glutamate receptor ionotropic like protein [Argiope bruennichi]